MYFLARQWTGMRLAAAVAGMAFAFNGLTLNCLMWPNNIAALGWMPWVVLFVERGCRNGGRTVPAAAVVGASQMLAGAPEIIVFTWAIILAVFAQQMASGQTGRGRLWGRFATIVSLVAVLSAAQLLPFFEFLANSQRDTRFASSEWSMPGTGWANFLVPLFHCFFAIHGVFLQHGQTWTSSYYPGVGIVVLACAAAWRIDAPRVRLLVLLTVLSIVLALGDDGYLYPWLKRIAPQIGFLRFSIKFVVIEFSVFHCWRRKQLPGCYATRPMWRRTGAWPMRVGLGS
jgi:hypothetical protein